MIYLKYFYYIIGILLTSLSFYLLFEFKPKDLFTFDFWLVTIDFYLGLICIRLADKLDRIY